MTPAVSFDKEPEMPDVRRTSFALGGKIELQVRLGHGSLIVRAQDELTETSVAITAREPGSDAAERVAVALNGATLTVSAPRQGGLADLLTNWRSGHDAVDVEVTVPSGTPVKIATFTAPVTVHGRCGRADVATGVGAIELDQVDGDLRVRAGQGSCTAGRVTGSAVAKTGAGSVRFGEVDGNVQAGFGSGDLEIGTAHGSVRTRSGSGDARLAAAYGDVDFAAGSGRVSIGLPAGVAARLDVRTGSGQVVSDLPIDDQRVGGGPSITVRARTGSGDVRLFRAA